MAVSMLTQRSVWIPAWGSAVLLALCGTAPAYARPEYQEALVRYYEGYTLQSLGKCTACHLIPPGLDVEGTVEEMPPHTIFGEQIDSLGAELETAGKRGDLPARLQAAAMLDADGDGLPNELELLAGTMPGDSQSVIAAPEVASAEQAWTNFKGRYVWRVWEPVARPALPAVKDLAWCKNPIDQFVAAEHEKRQLVPASEAPRAVLLRRVSLDLTGLPPTRAQLVAFLQDEAPDAYERAVQELLESPAYGERWGRHWMDIWRYSDWAGWNDGGQIRDSQPHIWRWRDWIIESLNQDRGYDQMLKEMLAADELAPDDPRTLRATGFLARNYKLLSREIWMQDVVNHTSKAFLGMTLECARCHDHKFDAISQQEYYQFRAIFEPHSVRIDPLSTSTVETVQGPSNDRSELNLTRAYDAELAAPTYLFHRGDERHPDKDHPLQPGLPALLGGPAYQPRAITFPPQVAYPGLLPAVRARLQAELDAELLSVLGKLAALPPAERSQAYDLLLADLRVVEARLVSLRARFAADDAVYASPQPTDLPQRKQSAAWAEKRAALAAAEKGRLVALQARDAAAADQREPLEKALAEREAEVAKARAALDVASEEYPAVTPQYPNSSTGRRLALAEWITSPDNPLTARVAANHVWGRHFGQAIVPSTFDFGLGGRAPSHPALLDWLAAELMQPQWELEATPSGLRWVQATTPPTAWSMKHLHRLIVTSSVYRQAAQGESAGPQADPENALLWKWPTRRLEAEAVRDSVLLVSGTLDQTLGGPELDHLQGNAIPRRSVYFRHAQEKQMLMLKLFDCAGVTECYERRAAIVPQQALALMNSDFALRHARVLAERLTQSDGKTDDGEFISAAFETVLSRPVAPQELSECRAFLSSAQETSAADQLQARQDLVQVLFNHNDFVLLQ